MVLSGVISVSQLVDALQDLVEENFVEVLVRGELSNLARPPSGHCYFSLKDGRSQLRCAMFRGQVRALRFRPENGMQVICRGRVSIYPQRGDLQLIIEDVQPEGVGALQLAFAQLKEKLQQEGLFAAERKRPLPAYPRCIGVVTSISGAALQDLLNVLQRRSAGVRVLIRDVRVQGEGAAAEIAAGIADLNRHGRADVLIVGRGGGSQEDLWAFNEETVARAVAASAIPVISAVGHEVDISIADLVADLRAPTPSAAAEMVVRNRLDLERHLDQLTQRLAVQMRARTELLGRQLDGLCKRLRAPNELLRQRQVQLERQEERLEQLLKTILLRAEQQLKVLSGRLDSLSPLAVLARGYAIATDSRSGMLLTDAGQVKKGAPVSVRLHQGTFQATVNGSAPDTEGKT